MPAQPGLFTPVKVGPLVLPNRIVMSPMTRIRADEGCIPFERMARYYSPRASAGLIITVGTHPSPWACGPSTVVTITAISITPRWRNKVGPGRLCSPRRRTIGRLRGGLHVDPHSWEYRHANSASGIRFRLPTLHWHVFVTGFPVGLDPRHLVLRGFVRADDPGGPNAAG
jgi:NADH:flavin oxidoreductase / NADH oxidase family